MMLSSWMILGWIVGDVRTRYGLLRVVRAASPSSSWSGGYPELLLPSTAVAAFHEDDKGSRARPEEITDDAKDDSFIGAVLNYVSPRVRQMQLLRNPSGRDVFLPPDDHHVEDAPMSSCWDPRTVTVRDGRRHHQQLKLDVNGFELVHSPLRLLSVAPDGPRPAPIDFSDPADVAHKYYPLCESLVRETWEATQNNTATDRRGSRRRHRVFVHAFDHNVRHADARHHDGDDTDDERSTTPTTTTGALPPAGIVHNDYTSVSAPRRLEQLASRAVFQNDVSTKAADGVNHGIPTHWIRDALRGKRRYAFVNVWRSIDPQHPVESFPLGLLDAQSTHVHNDVRLLQIHYVDRIGENYVAAFHDDHQWYYFPHMTMDEAILIKQWDSYGDLCYRRRGSQQQQRPHGTEARARSTVPSRPVEVGVDDDSPSTPPRSTFALHTAFACAAPDFRRHPPPRKSIEVRCICIWEDVDEDEDEGDDENYEGFRIPTTKGAKTE